VRMKRAEKKVTKGPNALDNCRRGRQKKGVSLAGRKARKIQERLWGVQTSKKRTQAVTAGLRLGGGGLPDKMVKIRVWGIPFCHLQSDDEKKNSAVDTGHGKNKGERRRRVK